MAGTLIAKKKSEGEQEIVLRLLEHVAEDQQVSQAQFAKRVGIAKGLANAYFNRCIQKGWIKLRQVPRQRYLYYLTPKGFAEKARLTGEFLSSSYQFYRKARADLVTSMQEAAENGHKTIAVLGKGELAEIAFIVSDGSSIEIVGFLAPGSERDMVLNLPVRDRWAKLDGAQAALLATVDDAKQLYDAFRRENPLVRVYVPRHLKGLVEVAP